MDRRCFLGTLAGLLADPERLLWIPGKSLISIPKARRIESFELGYLPLSSLIANGGGARLSMPAGQFALISRPPYYRDRIGNVLEPGEQMTVNTFGPERLGPERLLFEADDANLVLIQWLGYDYSTPLRSDR